jgi:Zn-finger nucleic acid-binding protein
MPDLPEPNDSAAPSVPVRPLETRWPCPVCVGVAMEKAPLGGTSGSLTIDYCPRCGGLWFDRGEVGQLAKRSPSVIRQFVAERADRIRPPCHGCLAPLDRDAEKCPACGHRNELDCPRCDRPMERRAHAGLVLDLCSKCHGVWFDNAELSSIWRINVTAATARARSKRGSRAADAGDVLLNAMFWTPDLVLYGGMAAGHAAGAAVEVVGDAAEGVFATVMEIIAGLFD